MPGVPSTSSNNQHNSAVSPTTGDPGILNRENIKIVAKHWVENTKVPEHLKPLVPYLNNHIEKNLVGRREISPGMFTTNFNDRVICESEATLIPKGLEAQEIGGVKREIMNNMLIRDENPCAPLTCNTFTIEDILQGRPPSLNSIKIPTNVSITGKDCLGNQVFILPSEHPHALSIGQQLNYGELIERAGGTCSWKSAAWMSSLLQIKPNDLKIILDAKLKNDKALAARVMKLSNAIHADSAKPSLDKVTNKPDGDTQLDDGGLKLQYPEDDDLKGHDCEKDLDAVMEKLMNNKIGPNDKSIGKDMINSQSEKVPAHAFSLMKALGATGVVIGDHTKADKDGKSFIATSDHNVSSPDALAHACGTRPVLIKVGDHYSVAIHEGEPLALKPIANRPESVQPKPVDLSGPAAAVNSAIADVAVTTPGLGNGPNIPIKVN
jgi:hypothetical protein